MPNIEYDPNMDYDSLSLEVQQKLDHLYKLTNVMERYLSSALLQAEKIRDYAKKNPEIAYFVEYELVDYYREHMRNTLQDTDRPDL